MFLFCSQQLDGKLCWFLLLPSKVHADALNDWQHPKAKIATKSEMYMKYGRAIYCWRNASTITGYH